MNIILIGEPKIGKSTLLSKSINQIDSPLIKFQGVISKEIRDENQIRQGFRAITSSGVNEIFAHKKEIESQITVGEYKIDNQAIKETFIYQIDQFLDSKDDFFYLDEIGRIQMASTEFRTSYPKLLIDPRPLVATVSNDEPWTKDLTGRLNSFVIEVNLFNRDSLADTLTSIMKGLIFIPKLNEDQIYYLIQKARYYLNINNPTLVQYLFERTTKYLVEKRFKYLSEDEIIVEGDRERHRILVIKEGQYVCDCNLFNGRNEFDGQYGDCPHIQTLRLDKLTTK